MGMIGNKSPGTVTKVSSKIPTWMPSVEYQPGDVIELSRPLRLRPDRKGRFKRGKLLPKYIIVIHKGDL